MTLLSPHGYLNELAFSVLEVLPVIHSGYLEMEAFTFCHRHVFPI